MVLELWLVFILTAKLNRGSKMMNITKIPTNTCTFASLARCLAANSLGNQNGLHKSECGLPQSGMEPQRQILTCDTDDGKRSAIQACQCALNRCRHHQCWRRELRSCDVSWHSHPQPASQAQNGRWRLPFILWFRCNTWIRENIEDQILEFPKYPQEGNQKHSKTTSRKSPARWSVGLQFCIRHLSRMHRKLT